MTLPRAINGMQVNLLIDNSREIISLEQASFLTDRRKTDGCDSECLVCHFRGRYLRNLDTDVIESFLANEFQVTDRPIQGGEQTVGFIDDLAVVIPNGVYYDALRLESEDAEDEQIRKYIKRSWKFPLSHTHIRLIFEHYETSLPLDENGVPIYPDEIGPPAHDGHYLQMLPTEPVTPRLGNPRSSFSVVPPEYSPRPWLNGVQLRHPHEVVAEGGQVAPFYPPVGAPNPPTYDSHGPFQQPPTYESHELSRLILSLDLAGLSLATFNAPPLPQRNPRRVQLPPPSAPPRSPDQRQELTFFGDIPEWSLPSREEVIRYLNIPRLVKQDMNQARLQEMIDREVAIMDHNIDVLADATDAFTNPRTPPPLPSPASSSEASWGFPVPPRAPRPQRRPLRRTTAGPSAMNDHASEAASSNVESVNYGGSETDAPVDLADIPIEDAQHEIDRRIYLASQFYLQSRGILSTVESPSGTANIYGEYKTLTAFIPMKLEQLTPACSAGIGGVVFMQQDDRVQPFYVHGSIPRALLEAFPWRTQPLSYSHLRLVDVATAEIRRKLNIEITPLPMNEQDPTFGVPLPGYDPSLFHLGDSGVDSPLRSLEFTEILVSCDKLHAAMRQKEEPWMQELCIEALGQLLVQDDIARRVLSLYPSNTRWSIDTLLQAFETIRLKRWMDKWEIESQLAIQRLHEMEDDPMEFWLDQLKLISARESWAPEEPAFSVPADRLNDFLFHLPDDVFTDDSVLFEPLSTRKLSDFTADEIYGALDETSEFVFVLCYTVVQELLKSDGMIYRVVAWYSPEDHIYTGELVKALKEVEENRVMADIVARCTEYQNSKLLEEPTDPEVESWCDELDVPSLLSLTELGKYAHCLEDAREKYPELMEELVSHFPEYTHYTITLTKAILNLVESAKKDKERKRRDEEARTSLAISNESLRRLSNDISTFKTIKDAEAQLEQSTTSTIFTRQPDGLFLPTSPTAAFTSNDLATAWSANESSHQRLRFLEPTSPHTVTAAAEQQEYQAYHPPSPLTSTHLNEFVRELEDAAAPYDPPTPYPTGYTPPNTTPLYPPERLIALTSTIDSIRTLSSISQNLLSQIREDEYLPDHLLDAIESLAWKVRVGEAEVDGFLRAGADSGASGIASLRRGAISE